jgi:hypothetical protein
MPVKRVVRWDGVLEPGIPSVDVDGIQWSVTDYWSLVTDSPCHKVRLFLVAHADVLRREFAAL